MDKRCKDITGQRFGSLVAIEYSHSKSRMAYWKYKCDCGKTITTRANTVTYEDKKNKDNRFPSCGCAMLAKVTKHGMRSLGKKHPIYGSYNGMMTRCYDKNSTGYKWYGEKGVTICDEWKSHPEVFCAWALENGWGKGLHIDKDIKCEKLGIKPHTYSPETCQFVTAKVNVGFATNRSNYGIHPNVKLSQDQADEICRLFVSSGKTNRTELASKYGVTYCSITLIIQKAGIELK